MNRGLRVRDGDFDLGSVFKNSEQKVDLDFGKLTKTGDTGSTREHEVRYGGRFLVLVVKIAP